MNDPKGRYASLKPITIRFPDGRTDACLPRRFLPLEPAVQAQGEFMVPMRERVDQLAARVLGSADHGWMLADANEAMRLEELEDCAGRTLRVPGPTRV